MSKVSSEYVRTRTASSSIYWHTKSQDRWKQHPIYVIYKVMNLITQNVKASLEPQMSLTMKANMWHQVPLGSGKQLCPQREESLLADKVATKPFCPTNAAGHLHIGLYQFCVPSRQSSTSHQPEVQDLLLSRIQLQRQHWLTNILLNKAKDIMKSPKRTN